ncbi:hypothetical protein THAOC_06414 [Thalassiosira oceanica]|uniref:Uncharacterized protein n=1 Tax=Thalassiosira oceanica TaxID=159749 RepID=K0TF01_THAOC|nr:hypothetical protein THAOC_06414 [Thalassiosira oceanica]|eukprot:EJK72091.1 hypothetical protein THAOC_06414 [Thalassiosira oceanica]
MIASEWRQKLIIPWKMRFIIDFLFTKMDFLIPYSQPRIRLAAPERTSCHLGSIVFSRRLLTVLFAIFCDLCCN